MEIEELASDLESKAGESLAAAGLEQTAENIKLMNDKIRRESPATGSQHPSMDEAFKEFAAGQRVYRE